MKIWEIDRSVAGKRYRNTDNGDLLITNKRGDLHSPGGCYLTEKYTLGEILELDFIAEKQLSKDERTIARNFPKEFEYIARDKDKELWLYKEKPEKVEDEWDEEYPISIELFNHLFQQIQWQDDEPTLISDIIN